MPTLARDNLEIRTRKMCNAKIQDQKALSLVCVGVIAVWCSVARKLLARAHLPCVLVPELLVGLRHA
eukprot:6286896-Amphidinium_carterae.1